MSYVELHCHSAFSFLDGASQPDELVGAAIERGHTALALTDHNAVSGSMEFAQAAKALGLRALHGAEVDVRGDDVPPEAVGDGLGLHGRQATRHLTLLVRDATGWANLCRLLTRAHAHTRGAVDLAGPADGAPPLSGGWAGAVELGADAGRLADAGLAAAGDVDPAVLGPAALGASRAPTAKRSSARHRRTVLAPSVTLAEVEAHAEGLVCLTGCAGRGVRDERWLRRLVRAFGRDGLRVELQRPFGRHDRAVNRELADLAARLGVRTVATGDVHAHSKERALLQDVLVAVREHTTLDASEPLRRGNHAHVLATPQAMAARFADHPDAVAETARLAAELRFDLTQDLGYRYPGAEDDGADAELAATCQGVFDSRYPPGHPLRADASARLDEELRLIAGLGLSGFFVLHRDLLELARDVALQVRGPSAARALLPPGRGRGSSVSSIVCYLTGLSHVDPIANRLLLGRFLNEEITTLPDIDLDFPRDIREVLIPRVHDRWGSDRSALVAAFPTFKARGAIRELGKALGLPPGEIERVARGSEAWSRDSVDTDVEVALGGERLKEGRWRWLVRLAHESYGLPRHLSQHSGGMIVATRPLVDCCPVVPAAMEGRQMVMWDKDSCSDAGFLKIDLLGLGMLSSVERCVDQIARRRGECVDLSRIRFDDPEVFATIQRAETTGVFQIESRAQMGSLRRTKPETLDDLTVQVAIVRPGPIQGGAVNPYIDRRQRLREDPSYRVPYDHPSLEPVLRDTLGTIIFQDQVIEVAMAFSGFTAGEAEGLRRAMSRKRSVAALEAYHRRFVQGAMARWDDVDEALGERVWSMVVGFSGFGFPKAHGAAFGLLAYQSTWLRVHYAPEFLAALLDEQPMGFYPPDALVHEAQRRGIEVLPPDVNASEVGCTVTPEGTVRVGLGYVLGVRAEEVAEVVRARQEGGPFRSLQDLVARAGTGRAALERLAWSGACDALATADIERELAEAEAAGHGQATARARLGRGASPDAAHSADPGGDRAVLAGVGRNHNIGIPALAAMRGGVGDLTPLAIARELWIGGPSSEAARLASPEPVAGYLPDDALPAPGGPSGADGGAGPSLAVAPARSPHARRVALWRLGAATPAVGVQGGSQLALPLELPDAPELRPLSRWEAMVADYATTGMTVHDHPMGVLREGLQARGAVASTDLDRLRHGTPVHIAGLVVARQRPGTAKGVAFLLLEDELGTVNIIVPPPVYERDRLAVRAEPLVIAEGTLERFASAGGAVNVLVRRLRPLDVGSLRGSAPAAAADAVADLQARARRREAEEAAREAQPAAAAAAGGAGGGAGAGAGEGERSGGEDFRAVAPAVLSFTQGRRR